MITSLMKFENQVKLSLFETLPLPRTTTILYPSTRRFNRLPQICKRRSSEEVVPPKRKAKSSTKKPQREEETNRFEGRGQEPLAPTTRAYRNVSCEGQKMRLVCLRAVTIPALNPAPESDFNSFWNLRQFRFQIRIQEKVDS